MKTITSDKKTGRDTSRQPVFGCYNAHWLKLQWALSVQLLIFLQQPSF